MRFFLLLCFFIAACSGNQTITPETTYSKAEEFLIKKFKLKQIANMDSVVVYSAPDSAKFILKKKQAVAGDLNKDQLTDAIFSYFINNNENRLELNHLVFINTNGKLEIKAEIKDEVFIKKIENGVIYATKSKIAMDAPNFGCHRCIEKVQLHFLDNKFQ